MKIMIPPPQVLPIRKLPAVPLPSYRYVPGFNLHPSRLKHRHLGIAKESFHPQKNWQSDIAWLYGLDLFNYRFYWESHEVWEEPWKMLPKQEPYRLLLQGMIKASASILKRHMKHERPAKLLWSSAQIFFSQAKNVNRGINVKKLIEDIDLFHEQGIWPVIEFV